MSEVKRWRMSDMPLSEYGLYTEVVLASEYEKLNAKLSMTNSNWPYEKGLHETIAKQARVIEKLREQRNEYIAANWEQDEDDKNEVAEVGMRDAELAAIEKDGTK